MNAPTTTVAATTSNHHLVLIHGAWAGSWVWNAVKPLFQAAGYTLHAVDLPGNRGELPPDQVNLDVYCDYIQDKVLLPILASRNDVKVTLVGHSGAGVIALQLAENLGSSLHSLVIVCGMMLPSGLTYPEFRATLPSADLQKEPLQLHFSQDGLISTVVESSALECFFQDLPPDVGQQASQKLSAQPTGGLAICATYKTPGALHSIPKLYVEATRDQSVLLGTQRAMQGVFQHHNLRVISMETGHVPHVAQPKVFCRHVCDFLKSF